MTTRLFQDEFAKVTTVLEAVNAQQGQEDQFSEREAMAAINRLHDRNQIMLSDDVIYKI